MIDVAKLTGVEMASDDPQAESVLCIPSHVLDSVGRFQGYCNNFDTIRDILDPSNSTYSFRPRSEVEQDPSFKQIITYTVIQFGSIKKDALYFSYTRGKSGGEDRIKKKLSLGIGGHVSESILSHPIAFVPYKSNTWITRFKAEAKREIDEEVSYKSSNPLIYLAGMINDDSDPVGQVHLGLVYVFLCNDPYVKPKESSISDGSMITANQVRQNRELYESWSRIVIDSMYAF